jgi:hypothetical protein
MKRNFSFLQYKIRIGVLLTILIAAVIANNLWFSRNIKHMDNAANSIYNDRLMAATYISELTHLLYTSKLEMQKGKNYKSDVKGALSGLIINYESTILTKQERIYWEALKKNLHFSENGPITGMEDQDIDNALQNLQQLTKIQASEGNKLIGEIRQDINSTSIGLILEIIIAIVIGLLALTLLGISKNTIISAHPKTSLN